MFPNDFRKKISYFRAKKGSIMKFLLLIFVIIIYSGISSAVIIRVPQDHPTIQAAIDEAEDSDTILVAPGRYYENIIFRGKNIVLTSNYVFSNDPEEIDSTIIDGSQPASADTASCVRIVSNETAAAQLIGFTITGGKGTKWIDEHGAGTYREGGGILITLASPIIKYNRIVNNEASDMTGVISAGGGGIRVGDGNPVIEGNFIAYNKGRYGGGLVLNYTGAVVRNNIFYKNSGGEDFGGGAIWALAVGPAAKMIINNTVIENSSTAKGGGGVYVWGTPLILKNNIVYGNTGGTFPNIRLVSGGSITADYNLIEGGYAGTGNIDADPSLLNNFTLGASSPCIDAGDTNSVYNDPEDPARPGFAEPPSLGTIRNDIGAYGGPYILSFWQILTPVEEETETIPVSFSLFQNYPNPFNPTTSIKYSIPEEGYVELIISNILGEKLSDLVSENQQGGTYSVVLNAGHLPSGVYLYQLRFGGKSVVRKMTVIK
jgi:hypothetical protein